MSSELLVAPSGRKYTVHHFTVFFESTVSPELKDSIDQFQFVQHRDGSTTLNLVVNSRFDESVRRFLTQYWEREFGAPVETFIVDKLPMLSNNKCRFIIVEK